MREVKLYKREKLLEELQAIGNQLEQEITIYLIGGCAMSLKNLKEFTSKSESKCKAEEKPRPDYRSKGKA